MSRQRGTSKSRKTKVKPSGAKRTAAAARAKTAGKPGRKAAAGTGGKPASKTKAARKSTLKAASGSRSKAAGAGKTASRAAARKDEAEKVVKVPKKLSKAAMERIEKLRTMLEKRRSEIMASIRKAREDSVEAHRRTFSEVGDLVSASLEKEMAFKYGEYGVNMLREIDSALEKLKEGSYGICEECGRMIGVKRLEVVPFARLCIKCKSKEEEGSKGSA